MYAHYKCHQWPYVTNKWSRSWSSETVKQYFYRKMLILEKVNTINRKEVTGHWRWRDSRSLVWDEEKTRPGHMLGWMLQVPSVFWHVGCVTETASGPQKCVPLITKNSLKNSENKLSHGATICPPPIPADLSPCTNRCAVRTATVAWPRRCAPSWPRWDRQKDGQMDHGIA